MHQINNHTFLTSPELAARLGVSPRTVNDWANKNHPAANWNNYSHQWEWNLEEFLNWKLTKRTKPGKEPHSPSHEATGNGSVGESAKPRRGRKPKFKVVK